MDLDAMDIEACVRLIIDDHRAVPDALAGGPGYGAVVHWEFQ